MSDKALHIYTICFPEYDSITQLHGHLYRVRKNYFEKGISEKNVICDETAEISTKYRYYISQWGMGWKKTVNDRLLEYSVPERHGCAIFFLDSESHHYEKIQYDENLDWIKSYYFQKYDDSQTPAHAIELIDDRGILLLTTYGKDGTVESETKLYPGYSDVNTEINDLLDEKSGKPLLYAATNRGEVCFCTADQAKIRGIALEEIEPQALSMDLEDVLTPSYNWDERGAQLFAECVSLLGGSEVDQELDQMERLLRESVTVVRQEEDNQVEEELRKTIRETEDWIRQLSATTIAAQNPVVEDNKELFSYSTVDGKAQDADVAEIMGIISGMEQRNRAYSAEKKQKKPVSIGKSLEEQMERLRRSGQKLPSRYTVAGKKTNSKMVHAKEVFDGKGKIQAG